MRFFGGLVAASLIATAPVHAQNGHQAAQSFTPEEDLDCAIYIGAIMAETEVEMTPESRLALTSAFTYFIGRYEAQRGTPLAQALAERYPLYAERNATEIEQTCSLRARGFAARMQDSARVMPQVRTPPEAESEPDE